MKMRKILIALFFACSLLASISCEKISVDHKADKIDFHNLEDRVGIWINSDLIDTLDFIDETNLIRKGRLYSYEEYYYRIVGDTLFISNKSRSIETQHVFKDLKENSVLISNMFITVGFTDNSEIFIKQD
jgi:hypothetical protein